MSCPSRHVRSLSSAALAVALALTSAHARAQAAPADVQHAWELLDSASSNAAAGRWDRALEAYEASNRIAPSVIAREGIANANFHLGRDEEALAAYRDLLALNPQFPEGKPELKREWERTRRGAEERVRELEARRAHGEPKPPAPKESVRTVEDAHEERTPRDKPAHAKEDERRTRTANNSVFVEGLGNGLAYSVNYERIFESPDLGLRVGASYMSVGASGDGGSSKVSWFSLPVVGSLYVGSENHKLQLGLGVTFVYVTSAVQSGSLVGSSSGLVPMPTAVVGYRYIPAKGGFAFSVGFTPLYVTGRGGGFLPWGGLSLGAVF